MNIFTGLSVLVPAVLLLALSFFILLVNRKNDSPALKLFGYAIVLLLWFFALVIFSRIIVIGSGKSSCSGNMPMLNEDNKADMMPMMGHGKGMPKADKP